MKKTHPFNLFLIIVAICITNIAQAQKTGTFTDKRDGQTYKTVQIGKQVWMAENLNFEMPNSWCYNDSAKYCETYGRLYTFGDALKACPEGWHLASDEEWTELTIEVGGERVASHAIKTTEGWRGSDPATNASGFSALPGGYRRGDTGDFNDEGGYGDFWTATALDSAEAYARYVFYHSRKLYRNTDRKSYGFSVRCVKD